MFCGMTWKNGVFTEEETILLDEPVRTLDKWGYEGRQ